MHLSFSSDKASDHSRHIALRDHHDHHKHIPDCAVLCCAVPSRVVPMFGQEACLYNYLRGVEEQFCCGNGDEDALLRWPNGEAGSLAEER